MTQKVTLWTLWKKDMYRARFGFAVIVISIAAWNLFLYLQQMDWSKDVILILSLAPLVTLPFFAFINGFTFLRREWNNKSIVQLHKLQVKSANILASKLLTLYVQIVLFTFLVLFCIMFIWKQPAFSHFSTGSVIIFILIFSALLTGLGVISQFSYVAGKMVKKSSWLVSLWVFFLTLWGVMKLTQYLLPLFVWFPSLPVQMDFLNQSGLQSLVIDTSPLGALTSSIVLIFLLGVWLLEKYVETQ